MTNQEVPISMALELASKQIDAGLLAQAEGILQQVLKKQPKNAQALHLMGVLAHRAGKAPLAIKLIGQALDLTPDNAQFHANIGEMLRMQRQLDAAIEHGERAVALAPRMASAHGNLGIAYFDKGDLDKAESCQRRALELSPGLVPALNNMGSIQRNRKNKSLAIEWYRKALAVHPAYVEARNNLGAVLVENEQPEEAIPELLRVIKEAPGYADAHYNIGNAFLVLEENEKALAAYGNALKFRPDYAEAFIGLARLYRELENTTQALACASRAIAVAPDKAEAWLAQADVLVRLERHDEATEAYDKALSLNEELVPAWLGKGHLLTELGRLGEAEACITRAQLLAPDDAAPHVMMAHAKKMKEDDASFLALVAESEKAPPARENALTRNKRMSLSFALGKCYDDLRMPDKAFPFFEQGCRIKRSTINYSADATDAHFQAIMDFFTPERIASLKGDGELSDKPIFVLGMPRSGTTLTETIIASHPDVHGAGELPDILRIARHPVAGCDGRGYPFSLAGLDASAYGALGRSYLEGLSARAPGARHITDKMPGNFQCLGLIHLMLPNARIIHVKRNPADTCLSGYTKLFNNSQYQSYDLEELGRYYHGYARLMEHWRAVLPEGSFYEVQYEELVTDKEAQTRKLIEYCGLEWSDVCLESHKTDRVVKTASITQVRQPVYTSSVERWRAYEPYLQPLLDALGEYAPVRSGSI